jgi:hypothetical protein
MGLRLVFLVQPRDGIAGQGMTPPVRIAVQDAWGATQVTLNDELTIAVQGTGIAAVIPIVAGVADLSNIDFLAVGDGLRIMATRIGSPPAFSAPFDLRF